MVTQKFPREFAVPSCAFVWLDYVRRMSKMQAFTVTGGTLTPIEVAVPEPGLTQVRIRSHAIGVNPVDWKVKQHGPLPGSYTPDEELILGWDVAGTVEALGAGVAHLNIGDRVVGMPAFPRPARAYAEFVVSDSRQLARVPDGVDLTAVGGLPLAGLTAWQAVHDALVLKKGSRVLIHAASGGVGHLAVQLAAEAGAEVWATASQRHHERLTELGAHHVIDYRTQRFEEIAKGMTAVLDLYAADAYPDRSLACLERGGKLLVIPSAGAIPSAEALEAAGVTARWMLVEPDGHAMQALVDRVASGALKLFNGTTLPFAELPKLHELGEHGKGGFGKLVATFA